MCLQRCFASLEEKIKYRRVCVCACVLPPAIDFAGSVYACMRTRLLLFLPTMEPEACTTPLQSRDSVVRIKNSLFYFHIYFKGRRLVEVMWCLREFVKRERVMSRRQISFYFTSGKYV